MLLPSLEQVTLTRLQKSGLDSSLATVGAQTHSCALGGPAAQNGLVRDHLRRYKLNGFSSSNVRMPMRFRFFGSRQFSRRRLLAFLMALFSSISASKLFGQQSGQQFGQQRRFRDGAQVNFKQQLEQGLYARRPEEFAFIARVVRMVELNQLSRLLVDSTFQWARKKRPYPYVYFERGLKVRAARLGINVQ
jgi:hypothetical protein